jgi:hypothetical protein
VKFPEFPGLEEVKLCCGLFSRLLCDKEYLVDPSQLKQHKKIDVDKLVLDKAPDFYQQKNIVFEIAGPGYRLLSSDGDQDSNEVPYITKVRAMHFVVQAGNVDGFNEKIGLQASSPDFGQQHG